MVSRATVEEIERHLAAGVSFRKVAERVGVARGTVATIAARRHPAQRRPFGSAIVLAMGGPARRCRGCGGLVYMPCVACQVRAMVRDRGF